MASGLKPLRGFTALRELYMSNSGCTGSLEPLSGCTALVGLDLSHNQLLGTYIPSICIVIYTTIQYLVYYIFTYQMSEYK